MKTKLFYVSGVFVPANNAVAAKRVAQIFAPHKKLGPVSRRVAVEVSGPAAELEFAAQKEVAEAFVEHQRKKLPAHARAILQQASELIYEMEGVVARKDKALLARAMEFRNGILAEAIKASAEA